MTAIALVGVNTDVKQKNYSTDFNIAATRTIAISPEA